MKRKGRAKEGGGERKKGEGRKEKGDFHNPYTTL